MSDISWPDRWQQEAVDVVAPFVGEDRRVRIVVGPPERSLFGTVFEGFVYIEDGTLMIIHDHSGATDVYPWKLPIGPVLEVTYQPKPRARKVIAYRHPDWEPKR